MRGNCWKKYWTWPVNKAGKNQNCLFPLVAAGVKITRLPGFLYASVLLKINMGKKLVLDMVNGILQCVSYFIQVFFVDKKLRLLKNKIAVFLKSSAFRNSQIVVI